MSVEVSTVNVLLGMVVLLQTWIIKELITLKIKVALIADHCPMCGVKGDRESEGKTT
jgi:hypothetical protein